MPTRRKLLKTAAAGAGVAALASLRPLVAQVRTAAPVKVFDVMKYGAAGDGVTLDSAAFQNAIDQAAAYAGKAQVLVRGGKKFLIGTIQLKGSIDFHLADDAQLLISTRHEDYLGGLAGSVSGDAMANALGGVIIADHAQGLKSPAPATSRAAPKNS